MNNHAVKYAVMLLLSLMSICIVVIDRPLAVFIYDHLSALQRPLRAMMSFIEVVTGFTICTYLTGVILLLTGILLWAKNRNLHRANIFLYIGVTHIVSRFSAGLLKNVFDRTRPYAYVKDHTMGDFFVQGGSSFPSGHAAHFFSLFLPLVLLYPRYKWWWLALPVIVGLQRVLVNDHYPSDILAGVLIAFFFSVVFYKLLPQNKVSRKLV